jgi:hypothetical protein
MTTIRMVDVEPDRPLKVTSPWLDPNLTDCRPDTARQPPEGVLITAGGQTIA